MCLLNIGNFVVYCYDHWILITSKVRPSSAEKILHKPFFLTLPIIKKEKKKKHSSYDLMYLDKK